MRIGIGLGGSVTWALIAVLGMTAGAGRGSSHNDFPGWCTGESIW